MNDLFDDYGVSSTLSSTVTDGRYKYILCPNEENWPLYQYTLMPTHMRGMFHPGEFEGMELSEPFSFTKECCFMKLPDRTFLPIYTGMIREFKQKAADAGSPLDSFLLPHMKTPEGWKTKLFDLEKDPNELNPIEDPAVEARLRKAMVRLMIENDAPKEQYERMGLMKEYAEST